MTRYTRQDVLRILHLSSRQLMAWERAGLAPHFPGKEKAYAFEHLSQVRALRELRGKRLSLRSIRRSLDAMQRASGMQNALVETSVVHSGSGLAFRHAGALLDPVTQQLAFDFDAAKGRASSVSAEFETGAGGDHTRGRENVDTQVQEMFLRGVQLEESASTIAAATCLYQQILELNPGHAPACINLGTIFYNQQEFGRAEELYRRATEADPGYALAFFDLGNVLDEMQRLDDAILAYSRAIALVPGYADAHYNLALAFERQGERRRALRHWTAYVRLDPIGPWAAHAKGQTRKILSMERLSIVSRSGRRVAATG